VTRLESALQTQKEELTAELQRTQRALNEQRTRAEVLQEQLSRAPNIEEYQQLKQKLIVLQQALGYSVEGSVLSSPDAVLLDKCKKLETELVTLRTTCSERERENDELKKRLASAEHKIEEQHALIVKLEEDLSAQQQHFRSGSGNPGSLPSDSTSHSVTSSWTSLGPLPSTSESQHSELESSSSRHTSDSQHMLQIVLQQRDRFKQRIHEIEEVILFSVTHSFTHSFTLSLSLILFLFLSFSFSQLLFVILRFSF
jgi:uncharacterized protein YhaN